MPTSSAHHLSWGDSFWDSEPLATSFWCTKHVCAKCLDCCLQGQGHPEGMVPCTFFCPLTSKVLTKPLSAKPSICLCTVIGFSILGNYWIGNHIIRAKVRWRVWILSKYSPTLYLLIFWTEIKKMRRAMAPKHNYSLGDVLYYWRERKKKIAFIMPA